MKEILFPLDHTHLAAINRALERVPHVHVLMDKMIAAGMDVTEPRNMLNESHKNLVALKAQFFPGHP